MKVDSSTTKLFISSCVSSLINEFNAPGKVSAFEAKVTVAGFISAIKCRLNSELESIGVFYS
jgi:hypothetical protein